jgi:hypothetical protein
MMGNYGPDRTNFSQFGSFYQGIPENMAGSMGQSYGQGYGYANQNSNYGQSQQFLPSQQFYQSQNQVYQSQANQFQQIQAGQQGYPHSRFCQCIICSQSNMTQFQSCQATHRSPPHPNPPYSSQPFYPSNPSPYLPTQQNNNNSCILSVNNSQKNPNFLSETAASQNQDDQNLSEISNNCTATLSHKIAKMDQNCYSPFNKSSWVLQEKKMPTVSNSIGL